jgi:hypothetical protein
MKPSYYKYVLTCCISAISASCFAQGGKADSTSAPVVAYTTTAFYSAIGDQSRLYNGPEYTFYDPLIKGSPYLNDVDTFETGSVSYDGFDYNGVSILYDLNKGCVVILLSNKVTMIKLLSEKVASFDITGHHFIRLKTENAKGLASGFYDQLYKGGIELLVKSSKPILKTSANLSGTIETYFSLSKDTYLKKNGVYKSISGKSAMLGVLKDKKKELKQYIGNNNINFDDNKEEAMVKVAAYYDQLTK